MPRGKSPCSSPHESCGKVRGRSNSPKRRRQPGGPRSHRPSSKDKEWDNRDFGKSLGRDSDNSKDLDNNKARALNKDKDLDKDKYKNKKISDRAFATVCRVSLNKSQDGDKSIAGNQV